VGGDTALVLEINRTRTRVVVVVSIRSRRKQLPQKTILKKHFTFTFTLGVKVTPRIHGYRTAQLALHSGIAQLALYVLQYCVAGSELVGDGEWGVFTLQNIQVGQLRRTSWIKEMNNGKSLSLLQ
jgi:hypothetical protein